MRKSRLTVAFCVLVFVTGAVAAGNSRLLNRTAAPSKPESNNNPSLAPHTSAPPQDPTRQAQHTRNERHAFAADVPEHVVYGLLFREVEAFKRKAEEREHQDHGQDAASLRAHHKRRAKLNDHQDFVLGQIAANCQREVARLDRRAKAIIDAEKARHPFGRLKPGEALPAPPEELGRLERQRTDAVLKARDQLRAALGEEEFRRFDDFARKDGAEKIKPLLRGAFPRRTPRAESN
jgi:vacuolar-type H+-ATPase subunit I/STV1